jgi:hypothetical protein
MTNDFKFYNIGAEDTMETAKEKLAANGFQCLQAKATFLAISKVQEQRRGGKTTEKLEDIMAMDKVFEVYGKGLDYQEMPIDVIACKPLDDSPFAISTYFFSIFDHKILAIEINVEKFEIVKDKLTLKFGACLLERYCENENSILILIQNQGWHMKAYFYENLKPHFDKINEQKALKDKNIEQQINDAF